MKTKILSIGAFVVLIGVLIAISCSKSDDKLAVDKKLKAAVSCTGVPTWSASTIYPNAGMQVQYNCNLYRNNWYSQNQNPAQNSGPYQVWTLVGSCTGCGSSSSSSSSSSGGGTCVTSDFSLGQYFYMMDAWGGGGYCIWYNNMNSWGANAPNVNSTSIVGYPAMVRGCHWSACSSNSGLPKQISALGSLSTNWTQTGTGTAYDAAYDIWFDAASVPGNRAATYELMVWLNWTNTQPIATNYDASGNAVPFASNVSVGGATFNVYHRGNVMSFLLTSKSNSINFSIKPLADYCVSKGWISSSSVYLISIEAGWEIIKGGNYTTSSYGISGL